jgi:hypothetical protein
MIASAHSPERAVCCLVIGAAVGHGRLTARFQSKVSLLPPAGTPLLQKRALQLQGKETTS